MLSFLIFAGLAAAVAAPMAMVLSGDDGDDDPPLETEPDTEGLDEMLDASLPDDTITGEDPLTLPGFDPAVDTLELTVSDFDAEFSEIPLDGGGSSLVYTSGDQTFEVRFPDLAELPVDCIDIVFEGGDEEGGTVIPLSALLDGDDPLLPVVDAPDTPTGELAGDPLSPVADDPDVPTGETPTTDPLQPVVESSAAVFALFPETDEGLALAPEPEEFLVYASQSGPVAEAAEISDFTPGEDFLRITYYTEAPAGSVALDVSASQDGQDGVVSIDGRIFAVVLGVPDLTAEDIELDVQELLRPAG